LRADECAKIKAGLSSGVNSSSARYGELGAIDLLAPEKVSDGFNR